MGVKQAAGCYNVICFKKLVYNNDKYIYNI